MNDNATPKVGDPLCLDCIGYIYGPTLVNKLTKDDSSGLDTCIRCEKTRVCYKLPMVMTVRKRCPHCRGALE